MALLSLFVTTRAKIDQLDLDVSVSETHEGSATLTQTEVETGVNITDHITLSPIRLTIEGMISQTPLGASALVGSLSTAAGGLLAKAVTPGNASLSGAALTVAGGSIGGLVSNALGLNDGENGKPKARTPQDVYKYLLELRERRKPIEVVTALYHYESMVLTQVSVPRSVQTKGNLRFTATFEQIRVVTAQETDVTGAFASVGGQAASTAKLGKQSATQATSKTADDSTFGFKIYKYFGGGG